jgi:hypothetical protein
MKRASLWSEMRCFAVEAFLAANPSNDLIWAIHTYSPRNEIHRWRSEVWRLKAIPYTFIVEWWRWAILNTWLESKHLCPEIVVGSPRCLKTRLPHFRVTNHFETSQSRVSELNIHLKWPLWHDVLKPSLATFRWHTLLPRNSHCLRPKP